MHVYCPEDWLRVERFARRWHDVVRLDDAGIANATVMELAAKAFRRGDDKTALEIFGRGVLGSSRFDRLSPECYQQIWDNRRADRAQMIGEGFPALSEHQVATVGVPTLLLVGSESPSAFPRMSTRLLKLLPHARLDVVDGASHILHDDAPDRSIKTIKDFLLGQ